VEKWEKICFILCENLKRIGRSGEAGEGFGRCNTMLSAHKILRFFLLGVNVTADTDKLKGTELWAGINQGTFGEYYRNIEGHQ